MKNFSRVATALCLALFFIASCAHHARCEDKKLNILASVFPVYLFAANVCANVPGVSVSLLIPASAGCPHDFALRPLDARKLATTDILIINGGPLEEFLDKPIQSAGSKLAVIDASAGMKLLPGDDHHPNAHLFAAPADAAVMVGNIAKALAERDPERADAYKANAEAYAAELREISDKLRRVGGKAANRKIAIEHDALAYLALNADLEIALMFEHGDSAARLARVKKELLEKKPAALAGDSQYSDRLLQTLAKETGIPFIRLNPCAGGPENPPLDYYQRVMNENLRILEEHFDK